MERYIEKLIREFIEANGFVKESFVKDLARYLDAGIREEFMVTNVTQGMRRRVRRIGRG